MTLPVFPVVADGECQEAQSALGNWTTHLTGAYSVLEACGGIDEWTKNPRAVVQVAMLTWYTAHYLHISRCRADRRLSRWDAVTSLVSRQECVFPYTYFESVLRCRDDRLWTFFGLCGCPQSLVVPLIQLAHLAAEKQKTVSMRWVVFDASIVSEIEKSLEDWSHMSSTTAFDNEESMQQDQDCMHCSEAWRNGLLLYIYRVFRWEPGVAVPVHIVYRARVIMDHIFACRDEVFVSKQALLPLFFAGCEVTDRSAQKRIGKFCSSWDKRTGYHMFRSVMPLLEELWAEQKVKGPEKVWWGQIVDKRHSSESQHPLQTRLCFG